MQQGAKSVFVCYAKEDAAAATQLCAGLRSAGIDVWLDQAGGLRGGDDWKEKIEGQIRACVLFVPLISRHTTARDEGYFHVEWRLALDRKQGMADDISFLLPVAIDDTSTETARVPKEFRGVQWTRLREGKPTSDFINRLKELIAARAPVEQGPSQPKLLAAKPDVSSGITAISTRINILAGAPPHITGFVLPGTQRKRFLIRGVGPSLARLGVSPALPDPKLTLHSGSGASIATNDNWGANNSEVASQIERAIDQVGAFPLQHGMRDAALLVTLAPGAYTILLSSGTRASGEALLEIYPLID